MPGENTLVIHDAATLAFWRHQLRFAVRPDKAEIRLPGLAGTQNANLTARVRQLQRACGCATSGLFMSATAVVLLVSWFRSGSELTDVTLVDLLSLLGSIVLAALCGKGVGLLWARWRLLVLAASLRSIA